MQVATADYSTVVSHGASCTTVIGARNNIAPSTSTYMFDGKVRDVRIYDYELSADQVASLYSGNYNVAPKHGWKLDEGWDNGVSVPAKWYNWNS